MTEENSGVAKRNIFLVDHFSAELRAASAVVALLGIDVVGADQEELLAELLPPATARIHPVLLVGHGARVDDVLRAFAALVEGRVEIEVLALLEHRQHALRLAEEPKTLTHLSPTTSLRAFSAKVAGSEAGSSTTGTIFMPLMPPAALISSMAMMVALLRDSSTMAVVPRKREQHAHLDLAIRCTRQRIVLDPDVREAGEHASADGS